MGYDEKNATIAEGDFDDNDPAQGMDLRRIHDGRVSFAGSRVTAGTLSGILPKHGRGSQTLSAFPDMRRSSDRAWSALSRFPQAVSRRLQHPVEFRKNPLDTDAASRPHSSAALRASALLRTGGKNSRGGRFA